MEIKHEEKKIRKYIIATVTDPVTFLYKRPGKPEYNFFKDVEKSIKFVSRQDAQDTINMYKWHTSDNELDLVVIPVDITYELIEEQENPNSEKDCYINNYNDFVKQKCPFGATDDERYIIPFEFMSCFDELNNYICGGYIL